MFCGNCGEKLPENARFCANCGTSVESDTAPILQNNAQAAPNTVPIAPDNAQVVPDTAQAAPNTVPIVPDNAQVVPDTAQVTPDTAQAAPNSVQAEPDNAQAEPDNAQAEPDTAQAEPDTAQAEPDSVQAAPNNAPVAPDNAPVAPENVQAEPNNEQAAPNNAPVAPDNTPIAPDSVQAAPNNVQAEPDNTQVTPNTVPITTDADSEVKVKPRGFSSKKNIIIILLAAVLVLGIGAGITAIAVTNSPSFKVSKGIDLAERYLSELNYEQAVIEYERVLEIEPMNVEAYLGLAKAYEKMDDIDKAIEVLREGLERTGNKRIEKRLNKLLNQNKTGTLSGKICKASDQSTAIPGATINVYQNDALYTVQTADSTGNYSIKMPEGKYYIEIIAEGYIEFRSYADVTEEKNTYMETFLMVEHSENKTGVAGGTIINSLTGAGVDGVTLIVKKDWNNTDEHAQTVTTTVTDYDGSYSIELPLGNYTVIASKDGCLKSSFNIIIRPGITDNQNGTIFPEVSGDEFLITLTWGEYPEDLDSHVEGTLSNGEHFHVYFEEMAKNDGDINLCILDYDDTYSYGPEHITLKPTTDKPYYYYIYKFAGYGTVAASGAKITVYQGNKLIAEYNVPTNLGNDDYWNVFAIKDGRLITKNTITPSADISYAD